MSTCCSMRSSIEWRVDICSGVVLFTSCSDYLFHCGPLHRLQVDAYFTSVFSTDCRAISALVTEARLTAPSLMLVSAGLFISNFLWLCCFTPPLQCFLPFLKCVFPEALSALQLGSAVSCGGSFPEPAGIGSVQLEKNLVLFSQRAPLQLSLSPATKTLPCNPNIILLIEDFKKKIL